MATTRDLKKRITSTKNTQQTTKAMKMVSAAKLRRATDAVLSQRPYAREIAKLMGSLASYSEENKESGAGNEKKAVSLCLVMSSDRGLCGGYNGSAIKAATLFLATKQAQGKAVKFVFAGKKAYEIVKGRFKIDLVHFEEFGQKVTFKKAATLSKKILPLFEAGEIDEVYIIYNLFRNAMTQEIQTEQVLPLDLKTVSTAAENEVYTTETALFVPSKAELYEALSGKYFVVQVYKALLESQASEHGSRMSAMENATKNAGDMIRKLTLLYNKQRQALITKELLEIIAGSESQKVK